MSTCSAMETDEPPRTPKLGSVPLWLDFISQFLEEAGLTQALRGFREDMLVMSPEWERRMLPYAMRNLQIHLLDGLVHLPDEILAFQNNDPEELRLRELQKLYGEKCDSKSNVTKQISLFIAENRARINRSNRLEFLYNFHSKKERLFPDGQLTPADEERLLTTCARTDAKPQDRDIQIKYDIAKNEHGPLRRTMKSTKDFPAMAKKEVSAEALDNAPTLAKHPGLAERFNNIEEHLAIKYVPAPPYSLLERIRFVEDYIVSMEKEYPPWAALHFRQPKRGWPPPPSDNSVIVPTHLTSSARPMASSGFEGPSSEPPVPGPSAASGSISTRDPRKSRARPKSSLYRAVMDKLEVKRALDSMQPNH